MEFEKKGIPTVSIATTSFITTAQTTANVLGMAALPIVVIPHPLGGLQTPEVQARARKAIDDIVYAATTPVEQMVRDAEKKTPKTTVAASGKDYAEAAENMNRLFLKNKWSDGLPLVPPTREAVKWMLSGTDRNPKEVVGVLRPRNGIATVEMIATNAVMAGCLPEYMPVLLTIVEIAADPKFDLQGVLTTTGACSPIIIINGPIIKQLNINGKGNALGTGWRANAAIGRAFNLIGRNIAGSIPGLTDMTTYGAPWEFTMTLGENEEANPWQPLSVEKGFKKEDSTVTMLTIMGLSDIFSHQAVTGKEILMTFATQVKGGSALGPMMPDRKILFLVCPENAALLAKDGWTKDAIRSYVYENSRLPMREWLQVGDYRSFALPSLPKWIREMPSDYMMPTFYEPNSVEIIVAGGAGKHSAWMPSAKGQIITKKITLPKNWSEIAGKREAEE